MFGALVAAGASAVGLVPTLLMLLNGEINGRMDSVLITGSRWVNEHRGLMERNPFIIKSFLDNVAAHLRPSYLFIHGDTNLRHSPQLVGQLSPVDMLALSLAIAVAVVTIVRLLRESAHSTHARFEYIAPQSRWLIGIALCAVVCGFFGVVPAALTWESLPHALRSIGTWPFVPLFSGAILALGWSYKKWVPPCVALVAVGYSAYFLPAYYTAFDKVDGFTYLRELSDGIYQARYGQPRKGLEQFIAEHLGGGDEVVLYYLMHEGKLTCPQAQAITRGMRERAAHK